MAETSSNLMNHEQVGNTSIDHNTDYHVASPANGQRDDTKRIRDDIEETRAEMGSTIDAIQEKLSPHHVMQEVKKSVRDATVGKVKEVMQNVSEASKEVGASALNTVREDPLPFILVGSGLGLFILNRFRANGSPGNGADQISGQGTTGEIKDSGVIENAQTAVSDALTSVKDSAGNVAEKARDQFVQVSQQVKQGARSASYQVRSTLRERPLIVGAVAVALGALVALSIPTTEVEQEYLGEARDKVLDKAQDVAKETLDKVQSAVARTGDETKQQSHAVGT